MGILSDYQQHVQRLPTGLRRYLPLWFRRLLTSVYWAWYDALDFAAEAAGWLPSHRLRLMIYRHLLGISIGARTSVHRNCRFYRTREVRIGCHTVINRDVLLDGRLGLQIGDNVSISEGVILFTLQHDAHDPAFGLQGGPTVIADRVFIGARAMVLPGITVGEGSAIAAGAVVTHDVYPFTIVAGVPARPVGQRRPDLSYTLDYRKFLG